MKFTWGTGIFLFLLLFLSAAIIFIIFASKQQINLVHKDYYEKGVNYSEQMKVEARAKPFLKTLKTSSSINGFTISIEESLASRIDSGVMYMYRPSDKTKDIQIPVAAKAKDITFKKAELINGRYILKFTWFMEGIKYEISKPVSVQ